MKQASKKSINYASSSKRSHKKNYIIKQILHMLQDSLQEHPPYRSIPSDSMELSESDRARGSFESSSAAALSLIDSAPNFPLLPSNDPRGFTLPLVPYSGLALEIQLPPYSLATELDCLLFAPLTKFHPKKGYYFHISALTPN
jgi:hypothetical protein